MLESGSVTGVQKQVLFGTHKAFLYGGWILGSGPDPRKAGSTSGMGMGCGGGEGMRKAIAEGV